MSITNIRTRQTIDIDAVELRQIIQAAMGGNLTDDESRFEFVDGPEISNAAFIWNACFSVRPFANTESALAIMLSVLGEQLDVIQLLACEVTQDGN